MLDPIFNLTEEEKLELDNYWKEQAEKRQKRVERAGQSVSYPGDIGRGLVIQASADISQPAGDNTAAKKEAWKAFIRGELDYDPDLAFEYLEENWEEIEKEGFDFKKLSSDKPLLTDPSKLADYYLKLWG